MFTGIITDLGAVKAVGQAAAGSDARFVFATAYETAAIPEGASIACSGCCLTLVDKGAGWFAADVSAETLSKTTLGEWQEGTPVNFERPLKMGDELGGHVVSGHVDGVARVVDRQPEQGSLRFTLDAPGELAPFIASKRSVRASALTSSRTPPRSPPWAPAGPVTASTWKSICSHATFSVS